MTVQQPRVLSIAGTDPTGGAGVHADLKSIAAADGYGMGVVTSLVAQNTQGVRAVHTPPQAFLQAQLESVFDDVDVDALKIGMLGDASTIETVSRFLDDHPVRVVVVDPVMVATSGDRLLTSDAEEALRHFAVRHATVITPNIPELAVLSGTQQANDFEAAISQGQGFATETGVSVLVKGGHLSGPHASNALVSSNGEVHRIDIPRVETPNTHGTGCSLSSALATRLLIDATPAQAAEWATRWLYTAIVHADELNVGHGHGPVDHFHQLRHAAAAASTTPWQDTDPWHAPGSDAPRLTPQISPAGEHTQRLWDMAARSVWPATRELDFIRELHDGTLARSAFEFYLAQDALHLDDYARALALLSVKAPDTGSRLWWAEASQNAIIAEQELHRSWFADRTGHTEATSPSPVTLGYVNFLTAHTAIEDYPVGAAAVLPCFWLYAEVGLHMAAADGPDHPYHAWLSTYGGEDFIDEFRHAIAVTETALEGATDAQRRAAADAFMQACYFERDAFDQAARA